jgi:hypothetical protein
MTGEFGATGKMGLKGLMGMYCEHCCVEELLV